MCRAAWRTARQLQSSRPGNASVDIVDPRLLTSVHMFSYRRICAEVNRPREVIDMSPLRSVVLCGPVRTAIGTFGGSLKDIPAPDLGAAVIEATLARAGLKPDEVDTAVMGNVVQAGAKMNPARQAAIGAGLPVSVPAMTVNRVCGSAAQAILLGAANVAVAGGMENMDLAPYLIARGRWGYRMGDGQLYDSMLRD